MNLLEFDASGGGGGANEISWEGVTTHSPRLQHRRGGGGRRGATVAVTRAPPNLKTARGRVTSRASAWRAPTDERTARAYTPGPRRRWIAVVGNNNKFIIIIIIIARPRDADAVVTISVSVRSLPVCASVVLSRRQPSVPVTKSADGNAVVSAAPYRSLASRGR